jgi:hypothetical protein
MERVKKLGQILEVLSAGGEDDVITLSNYIKASGNHPPSL